jgi:hypothetical protein
MASSPSIIKPSVNKSEARLEPSFSSFYAAAGVLCPHLGYMVVDDAHDGRRIGRFVEISIHNEMIVN